MRFIDVIDNRDLTIELVDNNQPITNSEDKMVRKQNKRAAKRKMQLDNFCASMQALTASSTALLLPCPSFVSWLGSLAFLSSCPRSPTCLSLFSTYSGTPIALLSCFLLASGFRSPVILLSLPILSLTSSYLASIDFKTVKWALLDKPLHYSTTFVELLYLFPPLNLLPDKTDCKQTFDIAFINSRLLADNYTWEKLDLNFAKYSCPTAIKLNRLWQLELLNFKSVYIMETIPLAATIF